MVLSLRITIGAGWRRKAFGLVQRRGGRPEVVGLEQNSGSGFDKCRDITRAIIPATLYLHFPCSFTTPRDNLAPTPFHQRPSNQTFSFLLLITVHCSRTVLTNKLPIQRRVTGISRSPLTGVW